MVWIANPNDAHAITVVATEAMQSGMAGKLVQNVAGDVPGVAPIEEGDLVDPAVKVGVVMFVRDDDLAVDYKGITADGALVANPDEDNNLTIPADADCTFWYGSDLRIRYTEDAVDAAYDISTAREADAVTFNTTSALLADYDETEVDPELDAPVGFVLTNDGPTLLVTLSL